MAKRVSPVLQSHGLPSFCACLWQLEFAKSIGKCVLSVYGPSLEVSFVVVDSIARTLNGMFAFSPRFRFHFSEKCTPLSEVTQHCLQDMSYTCRHDVFFLESPTSNCMLALANLQLFAEHNLQGPPQRPFNTSFHGKSDLRVDMCAQCSPPDDMGAPNASRRT